MVKTKLSRLVRIGGVNTTADKTRQFCLVLTQFPICSCSVSNISMITEDWEIGNRVETRQNSSKLGRDKTKLSCLVCSCVTPPTQTRQSCLILCMSAMWTSYNGSRYVLVFFRAEHHFHVILASHSLSISFQLQLQTWTLCHCIYPTLLHCKISTHSGLY